MSFHCNHAIRVLETLSVPQRRLGSKILDLRPGDVRVVQKHRYRCLICDQTTGIWFLEPREALAGLYRVQYLVSDERLGELRLLLTRVAEGRPSWLPQLVDALRLCAASVDAPATSDEPNTECSHPKHAPSCKCEDCEARI